MENEKILKDENSNVEPMTLEEFYKFIAQIFRHEES